MLDSLARWDLGVAQWLRGRLAEAERVLRVRHRQLAGGRPVTVTALEPL